MSAKYLICVLMLAGAACATPAWAQCTAPTPPAATPDGSTASEAEMLAAMKSFKQFNASAELYLKCLADETAQAVSLRPSERGLLKEKLTETHNAMVDALQSAAGKFNKEVRIFKERTKG